MRLLTSSLCRTSVFLCIEAMIFSVNCDPVHRVSDEPAVDAITPPRRVGSLLSSVRLTHFIGNEHEKNFCMSPYSIDLAMNILYSISTKDSDIYADYVKYFVAPPSDVALLFREAEYDLPEPSKTDPVTQINHSTTENPTVRNSGLPMSGKKFYLRIAVKFLTDAPVKRQREYVTCKTCGTVPEKLVFDGNDHKRVNDWFGEMTHRRVPSIMTKQQIVSGKSLMVSSLYFKSPWNVRFFESNEVNYFTYWDSGQKVLTGIRYMKMVSSDPQHDRLLYATLPTPSGMTTNIVVLRIPFSHPRYSFTIFMPSNVDGIREVDNMLLESNIFDDLLQSAMVLYETSIHGSVSIHIPQFEITSRLSLKSPLTSIGLGRVFTSHVWNEASKTITISDILHYVFINVSTAGVDGTAATYVKDPSSLHPQVSQEFIIDRPFYFQIRRKSPINGGKDAVLFTGRLVDMAAARNFIEV